MRTESEVPADAVYRAFCDRDEIALLDVREEAEFATGHPLFAASMPLARLELEVFDRIPRKTTPIVCYDDGDGRASAATNRLRSLGYGDLATLDGGLDGWRSSGFELFEDVNAPSKAFGELVDATVGARSIEPGELDRRLRAGDEILVVDARRFEEFRTMSIPSATSVPGGELVYRVPAMVDSPTTMVVVNCAGRTRSIIGAQSLRNAGLANPVMALRNGTIGWSLAGLDLEHDVERAFSPIATPSGTVAKNVRSFAEACGVVHLRWPAFEQLIARTDKTTYCFDVRDAAEYQRQHREGFRHAPGGQLVQETDVFAPVRGASIVVADDDGVRADITASWLAQMGWRAAVLDDSTDGGAWSSGPWIPDQPQPPDVPTITSEALVERRAAGAVLVADLARSPSYRAHHIPGASFVRRVELARVLETAATGGEAVLTSEDGGAASWAAFDLIANGGSSVRVLEQGTQGWIAAGQPTESGRETWLSEPRDVYRRPYEGRDVDPATMQAYLDWEYGLVAQLERDRSHHFVVFAPHPPSPAVESGGRD